MREMLTMISFPSSYSAAVALVLQQLSPSESLERLCVTLDTGEARTERGGFDGWKLRLK